MKEVQKIEMNEDNIRKELSSPPQNLRSWSVESKLQCLAIVGPMGISGEIQKAPLGMSALPWKALILRKVLRSMDTSQGPVCGRWSDTRQVISELLPMGLDHKENP